MHINMHDLSVDDQYIHHSLCSLFRVCVVCSTIQYKVLDISALPIPNNIEHYQFMQGVYNYMGMH